MNQNFLKSLGEYFLFEGSFLLASIVSSILIDRWLEIIFEKLSEVLRYSRDGFFITFAEILFQFLVIGLFQISLREIFNQLQLTTALLTKAGVVSYNINITRLFYSFIALGSQKYLKNRFRRLVVYLQKWGTQASPKTP